MVIMEQCDLKQLHLRPVSPKAKSILNGPWITHICSDDNLLRFYHPASQPYDQNRAVLADEFDVQRVEMLFSHYWRLKGYLCSRLSYKFDPRGGEMFRSENFGPPIPTVISLEPYSDEEVAEAILFRTQIAYLLEDVKRFWQAGF